MRKEEILEKARADEDEMERLMMTQSLGLSTIMIPVLCIIFVIIRIVHSEYIISDLVTITLAQLSISQLYQSIKMKNTALFSIGIITLILTIVFFVCFINEVKL